MTFSRVDWEGAMSSHKLAPEADKPCEYITLGSDDAVQIGLQKTGCDLMVTSSKSRPTLWYAM